MSIYYYAGAVLLAVVVAALAAFISYRWLRQRNGNTSAAPTENTTPRQTGRRLRFWQSSGDTSQQLKKWLTDTLEDDALKTWVKNLSADDMKTLAAEINQFAQRMHFNPDWLFNGELTDNPELAQGLRETVMLHVQSRYRVTQVSGDIQVYNIYERLVGKQTSSLDNDQLQKVYKALLEKGLAEATPPDMIMAKDAERRDYLTGQIQAAANSDWATFSETLRQVFEIDASGTAAAVDTGKKRIRRRKASKSEDTPPTTNTDAGPSPAPAT